MEHANSLIQRSRSLGYAADGTPVDSGNEKMYQIEVGTYKAGNDADNAADGLDFTKPF
jgi:hypothetical protein